MCADAKPLISLLLVAALAWCILTSYLAEEISSYISEVMETLLSLFFAFTILMLLMVIFKNDFIVIPLSLLLGVFSLRLGLLGPVLLLLVILFFEKNFHNGRPLMIYKSIAW